MNNIKNNNRVHSSIIVQWAIILQSDVIIIIIICLYRAYTECRYTAVHMHCHHFLYDKMHVYK